MPEEQMINEADLSAVINPFPRLRLYFMPIMSTAVRRSLDLLETYWRRPPHTIPNGAYLALAIIRSALELREQNTLRIKQGLDILIRAVLKQEPDDLLKLLRNNRMLLHYGVLRHNEKPLPVVTLFTQYIKSLDKPLASTPHTAA